LVDLDVFIVRLDRLQELLRRLRVLAELDRETFLADVGLQAQAERWLHLVIEACLDLAQHLIADRGWPIPSTNREVFEILENHEVLTPALAEQMKGWAGFRNVLVHLYLRIDNVRVWEILTSELDQVQACAAALAEEVELGR